MKTEAVMKCSGNVVKNKWGFTIRLFGGKVGEGDQHVSARIFLTPEEFTKMFFDQFFEAELDVQISDETVMLIGKT